MMKILPKKFTGDMQRMKKQELLNRVHEAHKQVTNVLDSLTDEQLMRVGLNAEWSVKDLLAHLASWNERGARELVSIEQGTWQPQKLEIAAVHEFNAEVVNGKRIKPFSDVRADFDRAHEEMMRLIENLPEELDENSPALRVVNGTGIRHIVYHAAQLEEWKLKLSEGA
jgi:hypothetical protein